MSERKAMQASQPTPANIAPVTNQLKTVCEEFINDSTWFSFTIRPQINIAKNILEYLAKTPNYKNVYCLELASACIFQALLNVLPNLDDQVFLPEVQNKTRLITHVHDIPFEDMHWHLKTRDAIISFSIMLRASKGIEFSLDSLQRKIHIIDLFLNLKMVKDDNEKAQQTLSAITPSELNRHEFPNDFENLIYLMTDTAISIGCLDSLKKSLPYYLSDAPEELPISNPVSFTPEHHLLSTAITHHRKNILEWLISKDCPFQATKENFLYEAASILVCQNNSLYFEMIEMIFNEQPFNPNYHPLGKEPLIQIAMRKKNLYFINLLLQHPQFDLNSITDRKALQKITVEHYNLHGLSKWQLFNSADENQALHPEIRKIVMDYFHQLSYKGIMTFFANNPKETMPLQESDTLTSEASLKFCP
jgi:hypothetical protein